MSDAMIVLVVLASGTFVLKSAGPVLLGARRLPTSVQSVVDLLPAALLASLAIVSTLGDGRNMTIDARVVGIVVAAIALWRRAPFVLVIIAASGATATARFVM